MGCDIHMIMQKREGDAWIMAPQIEEYDWRNYTTFAIMADVRNYEHRKLPPISRFRGLPPDMYEVGWVINAEGLYDPEGKFVQYLGDHSFSYLTLQEVLDWPYWDEPLVASGVVEEEHYKAWNGIGTPPNVRCWITGPNLVTVSEDEWADVQHGWDVSDATLRQACSSLYGGFDEEKYAQLKKNRKNLKYAIETSWVYRPRDVTVALWEWIDRIKVHGDPKDIRMIFGFDN